MSRLIWHAVLAFPGPVLTVAHDRWFMQHFGGVRWELRDGRLIADPLRSVVCYALALMMT